MARCTDPHPHQRPVPARPPALADVTGVASSIDGDTIKVHGQRIREAVGVAPGDAARYHRPPVPR